jgi:hypothetical protein
MNYIPPRITILEIAMEKALPALPEYLVYPIGNPTVGNWSPKT